MQVTICDKHKIDIFVALFHLMKHWSSIIQLQFKKDELYIQCMDKSHVCVSIISIRPSWFTKYQINELHDIHLTFDCDSFYKIISYAQKNNTFDLVMEYRENENILHIHLLDTTDTKTDYDRFFELPLVDNEQDIFSIPEIEYDAEFSIRSKKFVEIMAQLVDFGLSLNIRCTEEIIQFHSSGDSGKIKVNIPIEDLTEFSISEGENIDIEYSLHHIYKMCLTTKLSPEIDIGIRANYPMRIKYDLGNNSHAFFFIAPKI